MYLAPDPEEAALAGAVAEFLADAMPIARLHREGHADMPPALRRRLGEMGWFALALPEERGGSGLTAVEHALFFREAGRQCGPIDLLAQCLAANACEDARMRGEIVAGDAGIALLAADGEGWRLLGHASASLALLVAPDEVRLLPLAAASAQPQAALDPANSLRQVAALPEPLEVLRTARIWQLGQLGCAAMLVGLAEAALDLIVDYAKMWTTDAQFADYQELLIRTDPASERHKGLTWLICDMTLPGIEIRPIRTMVGGDHVNTVFYDQVRIPLDNVVGEVGQGWSTAMATLSFERGLGFIGDQLELYERVNRAIDLAGKTRLEDGRLAIEADCMAIRAMTLADIAETDRTGMPGPKGSMMKLMVTDTHKALGEVAGEILGWSFLEFHGDRLSNPWTYDYLWSWVFSISGGASEIQRENVADRVLGLPRAR